MIFSIEEFSTFNGPGIRETVFFKGCSLRCRWCHNPEGLEKKAEILRNSNGCLHCGKCLPLSEKSIAACPRNLVRKVGEDLTAEEICEKVLKNADILRSSGGGVTFSGGEVLYQPELLLECLTLLEGKLHRAIQTSGFGAPQQFEETLKHCELVLFDVKLLDAEKFSYWCGGDISPILTNFRTLCASKVPFTVRVPLIPTVTDTAENLEAIAALLEQNGIEYVELLPYNRFAGGKYAFAGKVYDPGFNEDISPQIRGEIWNNHGIEVRVL